MVDYELRDDDVCQMHSIDPKRLKAAPKWWTCDEYRTNKWVVLRDTGVSRRSVHVAKHHAVDRLRTVDRVMYDLHEAWLLPRRARERASAPGRYRRPRGSTDEAAVLARVVDRCGHRSIPETFTNVAGRLLHAHRRPGQRRAKRFLKNGSLACASLLSGSLGRGRAPVHRRRPVQTRGTGQAVVGDAL